MIEATAVEGGQQHSPCSLVRCPPCMDGYLAVARVSGLHGPCRGSSQSLSEALAFPGGQDHGLAYITWPHSLVPAMIGGEESRVCPWPWVCVPPTMHAMLGAFTMHPTCVSGNVHTRKSTKSSGTCSAMD